MFSSRAGRPRGRPSLSQDSHIQHKEQLGSVNETAAIYRLPRHVEKFIFPWYHTTVFPGALSPAEFRLLEILLMKKNIFSAAALVLACLILFMTVLSGCGRKNEVPETSGAASGDAPVLEALPKEPEAPEVPEEPLSPEAEGGLTEEQALTAIRNYCVSVNPDLEDIVNAGEYPAYWEISSADDQQIVVLYRSYTGALVRYYIDRLTGETRVTEFVPGITEEEQPTEESFNVNLYLP